MAIRLKWSIIDGADVETFNIHRSIVGFSTPTEAPFGLINGDTLQIKLNNDTLQTITFSGDLAIGPLVDEINAQIEGGQAFAAVDSNILYLRSDIRSESGFLTIVGGTALSKLGQTARTISPQSEVLLLDSVAGTVFEFTDLNGVLEDFYGLQTVDSLGCVSVVSALTQAITFSGPICVIEGCVIDLQGVRVPDVLVTARIVTPPDTFGENEKAIVTKDLISTLSAEDGRFSLALLQGSEVLFEINNTGLSDPVLIPNQNFEFFSKLAIFDDYKIIDPVS